MYIVASYYSACGKRKKNEDTVSVSEFGDSLLALAADGLGGHRGGDRASHLAIQKIQDALMNQKLSADLLEAAIKRANHMIRGNLECPGMKTTIAALWVEKSTALFATVGDTRIYHFRDGEIWFQTRDHSVSQLAVLRGEISAEQIRSHHERNVLLRALGVEDEVKVDLHQDTIRAGDAFLICTDGFWEHVWERDMVQALNTSKTTNEWLQRMRLKAEADEGDNHSAVAIFIR